MKRLLLLLCLTLITAVTASAYDFSSKYENKYGIKKEIYYKITSANTVCVTYKNEIPNHYYDHIAIPNTVTYNGVTYTVTEIGDNAFQGCGLLSEVSIPKTTVKIGKHAFDNCTLLNNINFNFDLWTNSVLTEIDDYAFESCWNLKTFNLQNSLTRIGKYAFESCFDLNSIDLSNTLANIDEGAFRNCRNLTSFTIPTSLTAIKAKVFEGCYRLTSMTIPSNITSIGTEAFRQCGGLTYFKILGDTPPTLSPLAFTSVSSCILVIPNGKLSAYQTESQWNGFSYIYEEGTDFYVANSDGKRIYYQPNGSEAYVTNKGTYNSYSGDIVIPSNISFVGNTYVVKGINNGAFRDCTGLTSVSIPNSVTSIGNNAFLDCSQLTSINLPSNITTINDYTFTGCSSLTSVTIPNNVTSIGEEAFRNCSSITSVDLPASLTSIGDGAFWGCISLASVSIPNSVTSISGEAFSETALTSVTIPSSVTYIGDYAFGSCDNLTEIKIEKSTPPSINSSTFRDTPSNCGIIVPEGSLSAYQTAIGPAFSSRVYEYNYDLCVINDDGVPIYYIDDTNGYTVTYKDTRYNSYSGDVVIPTSLFNDDDVVKEIGASAFKDSDITSVTVPTTITDIGNGAFSGCQSMVAFYIDQDVVGTITMGTNVFDNSSTSSATLYVPKGCQEDYKTAAQWSEFQNIIAVSYDFFEVNADGVTIYYSYITEGSSDVAVTSRTTAYNSYTGDVVIPASVYNGQPCSVTSIDASAFKNSTGLTSVTIPNTVTTIGESAFSGCTGLTEIELPNSVTTLGEGVFTQCTNLKSIDLGNSVTSIPLSTFDRCISLESVNIPNSVTAIGVNAFSYCNKLQSVIIPGSVTSIGTYAFGECTALSEIKVENSDPSTITMGTTVFSNVPSTCALIVPDGKSSLYKAADQWSAFSGKTYTYNYNFTDVNEDGVTIYYQYVIGSAEARLTYKDSRLNSYAGNIVIPSTVRYNDTDLTVVQINNDAFNICSGLESVVLPEGIQIIGDKAFSSCYSLKSINIPASVTKIGPYAFYSCTSLQYITVNNANPNNITLDHSVFSNVPTSTCRLFVPAGSKSAYQAAAQWSAFTNIIEQGTTFSAENQDGVTIYYMINGEGPAVSVVSNTADAYAGTVVIPSEVVYDGFTYTVTSIAAEAFKACTSLKTVIIPATVNSIESSAFEGCTSLAKVNIPTSVTAVGNNAFKNCTGLLTVIAENANPANITLGLDVFYNVTFSICTLFVPEGGSQALYQAADQWQEFTNSREFYEAYYIEDGEMEYNEAADELYRNINYTRTFNHEGYYAIYLPYSMGYNDWAQYGEMYKINNVHQYDRDGDGVLESTTVEFNRINSGNILPHVPYVFRPNDSNVGQDVTFTTAYNMLYAAPMTPGFVDCCTTELRYTMTGTYVTLSGLCNDYTYALSVTGVFAKAVSDDQTLNPFRFYMTVTSRNDSNYGEEAPVMNLPDRIMLTIDGEIVGDATTGIEDIIIDAPQSDVYYDLTGRPVVNPSRGIYIKNGKKMFITE